MNIISSIVRFFVEIFNIRGLINKIRQRIINEMTSEKMDRILELLLEGMRLLFIFDKKFKNNIKGFKARYSFKSSDGKIGVSAVFKPGFLFLSDRMEVIKEAVDDTQVTVIFKDGKGVAELLLSDSPDVLNGMLENTLDYKGNLSYLLKFVYMARHIAHTFGLTA